MYRFGEFELDTDCFELREAGRVVKLEPRAFELLRLLIENSDRVIDRDEIIEKLWNGRIVSDAAISTCIKGARRAIGDDGKAQALIRTVHGRGFRFVGKFTHNLGQQILETLGAQDAVTQIALQETKSPEPGNESEAGTPTIAVMPFEVFGSNPDTAFLADGMVEDIVTILSKVPDLLVTARNSTLIYKDQAIDRQAAGRELGVRFLLRGSVRQIGNRVRVNVQLVEAETGVHLWAETFDSLGEDVFDLIDGVTKKVLEALEVRLTHGEQSRIFLRGSWSVRAYENFQLGRSLYLRFTRRSTAAAREKLLAAMADCPDWLAPRAYLGWTYADDARWDWGTPRETALAEAVRHFNDVQLYDPKMPFSIIGHGYVDMIKGNHREALKLVNQAIELVPSGGDVLHSGAMVANYSGDPVQGINYAKHAIRVVRIPQAHLLTEVGHGHILMDEPERAEPALRQALSISPYWASARVLLIWALTALGDDEGAKQTVQELINHHPRFNVKRWSTTQPYRDHGVLENQLTALNAAMQT